MSAPVFTRQPKPTSITVGTTGIILDAKAPTAASYQWEKYDTGSLSYLSVLGATNRYFTITDAESSDSGLYHVVATNADGSTNSDAVDVVVYDSNFDPMPDGYEPDVPAAPSDGVNGSPEGSANGYGNQGDVKWDFTNNVLYAKDTAGYGNTGWVRVLGMKVYRALLTQTGVNAPVATVLENTLGGTVVWTRDSQGTYHGTLASAFTANKTWANVAVTGVLGVAIVWLNASVIELYAGDDGFLTKHPVEILVYP